MRIAVKFEPRDIWIGVFWTRRNVFDSALPRAGHSALELWFCLVPMLAILVVFYRKHRR